MTSWPIGVFASVDAGLGVAWPVIQELGLPTIQLHSPHRDRRSESAAKEFADHLAHLDVTCTAVFGGFDGESYADIPTVQRTIGLVPPSTRQDRLAEMMQISDFAAYLGVDAVALHLGFVPHDTKDVDYDALVEVTKRLCGYVAGHDQYLHLETGQESAEGLMQFIESVGEPNLKINFDPANMILYGAGDPIEALRLVAPHVRSVHCKDGTWSDRPGVTWGAEVPLGQGDVDMRLYLETLRDVGYLGPLTIEREIPEDPERQKVEIRSAIKLLVDLRSALLDHPPSSV
ncbi:MAG: sugar phosphate isomerase/epimerase family protein [Planctomycetota bacterium]